MWSFLGYSNFRARGFSKSVCNLRVVAASAVSAHKTRAEEKQVTPHLESDMAFTVWSDPDRLRQMRGNLLDNALRYAPPTSTIAVRVRKDAGTGTVPVCDSGPGISHRPHA